jgi:hypothetical protein
MPESDVDQRRKIRFFEDLDYFPCRWDSRSGRSVAFSLGKTPMEVGASHYTHRENGLTACRVFQATALPHFSCGHMRNQ